MPDRVGLFVRRLHGWLWLLRQFGLRRTLRYRRAYREGVMIDYSAAFSPDELARLGEHFAPAPWEVKT